MQTPTTILLVEDDPEQLSLFSFVLQRLPLTLTTASNGTEALKSLKNAVPALIVLDISMPEISGLDVLKSVRADPRFDDTKILVLTAAPSRMVNQELPSFDMIMSKPISLGKLEQIARGLLNV
jgi:CheY-like chemotaxis protein